MLPRSFWKWTMAQTLSEMTTDGLSQVMSYADWWRIVYLWWIQASLCCRRMDGRLGDATESAT